MVVFKKWVDEHQKVAVVVAKDNDEKRQRGPGDLLMENKHRCWTRFRRTTRSLP